MIIYILNENCQMIGSVSNDAPNATPFYDDLHMQKIAENGSRIWSETFQMKVPTNTKESDMLERGKHLLLEDNEQKWKLFYIEEVTDSINGVGHMKEVLAYNSFMSDMRNYTYIEEEKTFNPAFTNDIIQVLCGNSGWEVQQPSFVGGDRTFTIAEGNSLENLDAFTTAFGLEIEAYIELKDGKVHKKHVRFFKTNDFEQDYKETFEYHNDLLGATRKSSNNDFATMIFPYTMANDEGIRKSIAPVNQQVNPFTGLKENVPFLYDTEANDKYNGGRPYIKKKIVSDIFGTREATLEWAKEQLKYYNHPKFEYTIDIALFQSKPNLAEKVRVVDLEMQPSLSIEARVIQKDVSYSNPSQNQLVLGEFKEIEIKPIGTIEAMQDKLSNLKNQAKSYVVQEVDNVALEGKLKVVVFEDGRIMQNLQPENFSWERYDNINNILDEDWTLSHQSFGDSINVTELEFEAYSYYCNVTVADYQYIGRADFRNGMTAFLKKVTPYINENSIVLGMMTDSHYDNDSIKNDADLKKAFSRALVYSRNLIEASHQIKMDSILHLGDLIDGRKTVKDDIDNKHLAKINLDTAVGVFELAQENTPRIFVKGNHDMNPIFDVQANKQNPNGVLTNQEAKNILSQFWNTDGIQGSSTDGTYGFYDIPNKNTRIIFLDSMDLNEIIVDGKRKYTVRDTYAFQQPQLQWLADTLISTPPQTDVLILSHVSLTSTSTRIDEINKQLVIDILNAWRTGGTKTFTSTVTDYTVSFTRDFGAPATGNIIATIAGHNHKDTAGRSTKFNSIIPSFTRTCAFNGYTPEEQAQRPFETLNETAFDLIVIDKATTTIRFFRYGYGADKFANYTDLQIINQDSNPSLDESGGEDSSSEAFSSNNLLKMSYFTGVHMTKDKLKVTTTTAFGGEVINNANLKLMLQPNTTYTIQYETVINSWDASKVVFNSSTHGALRLHNSATSASINTYTASKANKAYYDANGKLNLVVTHTTTFTTPASLDNWRFLIYGVRKMQTDGTTFSHVESTSIRNIQIELGNFMTDYRPNIDDKIHWEGV